MCQSEKVRTMEIGCLLQDEKLKNILCECQSTKKIPANERFDDRIHCFENLAEPLL